MRAPQLYLVTGKGGVGKTTVAAALGARAAAMGKRTLLVEISADRGFAPLFGKRVLKQEPVALAARLHAVRIEPRALVENYFTRLLRFQFLARRLFASSTFNTITSAAPGVMEFLILEHLLQWLDPGFFRRGKPYDLIVLDAPSTGHALRLLRTPRQIASMVPSGPIGSTARQLLAMLTDHSRTHVVLVTIPDEMAVNETLEARATLADDLTLDLTRPVLNRIVPRRFTHAEATHILQLADQESSHPLLAAARLHISARHDVERHLSRLRRSFGVLPVGVRQICTDGLGPRDLDHIGATLTRGLLRGNGPHPS